MKSPKNKSKKGDGDLKTEEKLAHVADKSKTIKKSPKSKNLPATNGEEKEASKTLSAVELARIAKKRAKKQGQKLRKKQKKLIAKTEEKDTKADIKTEDADSQSSIDEPTKQAAKSKKAKLAKKGNNKDKDAVKWERSPATEAATLFVGNLPINTKRVQLVRLFESYSKVQSIRLRTAGGKQLFKHKQRKAAGSLNAYVVLESAEVAEKALALNGSEFKGNHLRITPAAKVGNGVAADGADSAANDADVKRTIFVGNLKYSANEQKLREIFSSCGEIDYIRCLQDGEKGCKGVAYVCFQKPDAVGLALELNETLLDDRAIHVERYAVKKLGAKQARDSVAATAGSQTKSKQKQNSTSAKKRLDKKQQKENGKPAAPNKKKSEYRGVKVDAIKKNKKPKKKTDSQMNALAKKIAPKSK